MIFKNRQEAGAQLAKRLQSWAVGSNAVILAIPRGGVEVGFAIARELHLPLDILLAGKLGVPGQEELAFGAVAAGGVRYLNTKLVEAAGITPEQIEQLSEERLETLRRRDRLYRANRAPLDVARRTVILVDDGIATGASILVAIQAVHAMNPDRLIVAVPVSPISAADRVRAEVDELVCLSEPADFYAVGQFYRDFAPVSDSDIIELLDRAENMYQGQGTGSGSGRSAGSGLLHEGFQGEVTMQVGRVRLEGTLVLPSNATGLVLFAHGSGSSRHSPRNRYVAKVLQRRQIGTLLFDLLTQQEDEADQWRKQLRFDIPLLAERLTGATLWVEQQRGFRDLRLGYFGASTGAAAALVAAARLSNRIHAVVSRGGRPDLAAESLRDVHAPTLLLVGGRDEEVIGLNEKALAALGSAEKRLVIIPGATHLFEEPGALEQVADQAADWFHQHLEVNRLVSSAVGMRSA